MDVHTNEKNNPIINFRQLEMRHLGTSAALGDPLTDPYCSAG